MVGARYVERILDPKMPDTFASTFELEDFEDWVRITCWAPCDQTSDGVHAKLIKSVSLVIPRSSVYHLIEALRFSIGHHPQPPWAS
jgi:hypothetical protein